MCILACWKAVLEHIGFVPNQAPSLAVQPLRVFLIHLSLLTYAAQLRICDKIRHPRKQFLWTINKLERILV